MPRRAEPRDVGWPRGDDAAVAAADDDGDVAHWRTSGTKRPDCSPRTARGKGPDTLRDRAPPA